MSLRDMLLLHTTEREEKLVFQHYDHKSQLKITRNHDLNLTEKNHETSY